MLVSLPVMASFGGTPVSYTPLSNMNLSKGNTLNIETSIYPVTYRVYSYGNVDSQIEERLGSLLESSTKLLRQYASLKGLPVNDCEGEQVLEFYIVPYEVLNNKTKFSEWVHENGSENRSSNIVGLYSPRRSEYFIDSITLTDDSVYRDEVVAHEISHYWYERLCWSKHSSSSTEPLAMDFERYFISNYRSAIHTGAYSGELPYNNPREPVYELRDGYGSSSVRELPYVDPRDPIYELKK